MNRAFKPVTLTFKIAWRYLMAPKSHGAVSAISIISVAGVAVATAAIIVVLSVFNGFRFYLNARLDTLTPDISVSPLYGKTIEAGDSLALALEAFPGVEIAMPVVADNALIIADSKEMPVNLIGVKPQAYSKITAIDSLIVDGRPVVDYSPKEVSISVGVAQRMGMFAAGDTLFIFAPKRFGRVNMANPISSFITDSIEAASIFRSLQNEFDENTVICDISLARSMFQYTDEVTSIQIKADKDTDPLILSQQIQKHLGENYVVKDRARLQETNFRMVEIEKWITFLLLTFILLIASFNIISTLCMIILDKGASIKTLASLGLSRNRVGWIFWWESILVTLCGAIAGIIVGVVISLIQEKYGLIKLAGDPGSLVLLAYPVRVEWLDIAITMVPIAIIGLVAAWISAAFAQARALTNR